MSCKGEDISVNNLFCAGQCNDNALQCGARWQQSLSQSVLYIAMPICAKWDCWEDVLNKIACCQRAERVEPLRVNHTSFHTVQQKVHSERNWFSRRRRYPWHAADIAAWTAAGSEDHLHDSGGGVYSWMTSKFSWVVHLLTSPAEESDNLFSLMSLCRKLCPKWHGCDSKLTQKRTALTGHWCGDG